jgi:hypothetical protein
MRKILCHIVFVAAVLSMFVSCDRPPGVMSQRKMTRVCADMFIADQWLRDHPQYIVAADTTSFFDPVFRKSGVTFEGYNKSVRYYAGKPDEYAKILMNASKLLKKRGAERARQIARYAKKHPAQQFYGNILRDFQNDPLVWQSDFILWPKPKPQAEDTARTGTSADSAGVAADTVVKADKVLPLPGKFKGSMPRNSAKIKLN